jgi:hypothetical protein
MALSLPRVLLATSSALFVLGLAPPVGAQEIESEAARSRPVHVGAVAGLAFPRPISVEGFIGLGDRAVVGVEYGVLPPVTISGIRTTLWGVAGDARVFPFRGPFFVGLRAGVQHLGASGSVTLASTGPLGASLDATTWYLNPRIGVLWTFVSGVTLGVDAGVQVPIATSQSTSVPALANVPPQAMDSALARVSSVTDPIARHALPTFDLLQLGYTY